MSRFHITIRYINRRIRQLRALVRWVMDNVLKITPRIDYLQLECDGEGGPRVYDALRLTNDNREVINVLCTWLGVLHNVREVGMIKGLDKYEADVAMLKQRWLSSVAPEETPLTAMYTALEEQAGGFLLHMDDLREAVLAVENDDIEQFRKSSTAILEACTQRREDCTERLGGIKHIIRQLPGRDVNKDGDGKDAEGGQNQ